jgi:hypothetical protein
MRGCKQDYNNLTQLYKRHNRKALPTTGMPRNLFRWWNGWGSNVWYHVKLKYHASTQKVDIYITKKSTGESFYTTENADFQIDSFHYLGIGYYNKLDYGDEWSPIRVDNIRIAAIGKEPTFDTKQSKNPYPSIMGTHKGEIKPSCTINVSKLYTYSCVGTSGHTESIELHENTTLIASGTWNGYQDDYHKITITPSVILQAGHTYNYTIVTGSYPQIIHAKSKDVMGGTITCTSFVDANGKTYNDWIPAIRLE